MEDSGLTNVQKFEYWFNKAQALYDTRYDPFVDSKEIEWYINRFEECITNYMHYKDCEDKEQTLRLTPVMWLTYNPRKDVGLRKALSVVESFVKKSKITNYIYVVEQRNTTEADMGDFHIHILHQHTYDRSTHYKRETQSTFRKTCLVSKYSCLYFAPNDTDHDVKKRLKYILEEKCDDDGLNKRQKQEIDKLYRKKYLLKDYYTNDFSLWEKYLNL